MDGAGKFRKWFGMAIIVVAVPPADCEILGCLFRKVHGWLAWKKRDTEAVSFRVGMISWIMDEGRKLQEEQALIV